VNFSANQTTSTDRAVLSTRPWEYPIRITSRIFRSVPFPPPLGQETQSRPFAATWLFNTANCRSNSDAVETNKWMWSNTPSSEVGQSRCGSIIATRVISGALTHNMMVKKTHHICQSGDFATVTGRGQNTGTFQGAPISADEWITDVYCRQEGTWRCMLTHLTPAANAAADG
jgi:hypothetical protein